MKFFSGFMTLLLAIMISGVAGYFSVVGLAAIFAATFWPVIVMGSFLEAGKLVSAAWLHANWKNVNVNWLHKFYMILAIFALMIVTSVGIYGYLSKGHLEQEAPVAGTQLKIDQKVSQIEAKKIELSRLKDRMAQLDSAVQSLIDQKYVVNSQKLRETQKAERAQILVDQASAEKDIERLSNEILPLKLSNAEVAAKLGPVKYVADLFGWKDTDAAVRLVIIILMFAFDPLAVVLVLSSTITFSEWNEIRKKNISPSIDHIAPRNDDNELPSVMAPIIIKPYSQPIEQSNIPVSAIGDSIVPPNESIIELINVIPAMNEEIKEPESRIIFDEGTQEIIEFVEPIESEHIIINHVDIEPELLTWNKIRSGSEAKKTVGEILDIIENNTEFVDKIIEAVLEVYNKKQKNV